MGGPLEYLYPGYFNLLYPSYLLEYTPKQTVLCFQPPTLIYESLPFTYLLLTVHYLELG